MTSLPKQAPAPTQDSTAHVSLSPTDLAYMAGIVDGEGTITISRMAEKLRTCKGRVYRSSVQHVLSVSVHMSDRCVVESFHRAFGGYFNASKPTNKPMWVWQILANKAVPVIAALLPFLRTKRSQAMIGLEFQSQRTNQSHLQGRRGERGRIRSFRISPEEMAFRDEMCLRIQHLNSGRVQ